jgi:GT2 family glycosyltransferase
MVQRARTPVTAVLLSYHRPRTVAEVLERLRSLPIDEVIVHDNSTDDETAAVVRAAPGRVRLLGATENVGIAGRNRAVAQAANPLVLFLDDDSYPLPGAVELLVDQFDADPALGVLGGLVREVADDGSVRLEREVGSFDWWLRNGVTGRPPEAGIPTFFFPEGACMARRDAFLAVGGFYEPFFFASTEIDVATRLLAAGWDVRYQPRAVFDHLKVPAGRATPGDTLRFRIRNHLWYLWLRFPLASALPRMLFYGFFDLVNALYRRAPGAWIGGLLDAWRLRGTVRADRDPIPRGLIRRVEGQRTRLHLRLLSIRARHALLGRRGPVAVAGSTGEAG